MIDHEPVEIHPAFTWMDEDIEPDFVTRNENEHRLGWFAYTTVHYNPIIQIDGKDIDTLTEDLDCKSGLIEGSFQKIINDFKKYPGWKSKLDNLNKDNEVD